MGMPSGARVPLAAMDKSPGPGSLARETRVRQLHLPPDQRSEDRAVGPVEPGPRIGAAQHSDLVPQHEQLSIL